jgi:hypothetical protein
LRPGVLAGITLKDWLKLLRENWFSVDSAYLLRAVSISFAAVANSIFRWHEECRYGRNWRDLHVPPPLFVLGHWRSGTTHLHYQYKELYDAFFEERGLITAGHFHEIGFEELEKDPLGEMRKLYDALGLPEFGNVEPNLRTYLHSLRDYRKNTFPELASDVRRRIAGEWGRCFEEWGYAM